MTYYNPLKILFWIVIFMIIGQLFGTMIGLLSALGFLLVQLLID